MSDTDPHKLLTYVEYRAVSGVFQNSTHSPRLWCGGGCVLPPHQRRGEDTLAGQWGVGWGGAMGVNILEGARHWIGLLQYNLSTRFRNHRTVLTACVYRNRWARSEPTASRALVDRSSLASQECPSFNSH
jgi:hypothetical protein